MTLSRRSWASLVFLAVVPVLYAYGVISAGQIPAEVDVVALPLDFMVGIPLALCLITLRPNKVTPLAVLPVIWLGYVLSAFVLGSPTVGILPMLLGLCLAYPVEIIAMHMLLSQWSVAAAMVVTLLSLYATVWLIGDARARILRRVTLGKMSCESNAVSR